MACFGWGTTILLTVLQGELTHKQQLTRLMFLIFVKILTVVECGYSAEQHLA